MGGLCGVDFFRVNGYHHTCSGKVDTVRDGKHLAGYIIDEQDGIWTIRLVNGKEVKMLRVRYDLRLGEYRYDPCENVRRNSRVIKYYWPIRMLIRSSGDIKFTLNRLTFNTDNKLVPQYCS